MIAECQNEETLSMWTTANELLQISNNNDEKTRMEEFKRRFCEIRHHQIPLLSINNRKSHPSMQKSTSSSVKISFSPTFTHLLLLENPLFINSL
jgi:hypothetical protein